ncbi:hypothetical protein FRX31_013053 [Thalictrum thalictroides]|uniref:Uncharacterized protein n=1 Tax=Thalictrum thalictroides TaxID=46969 RepID=A0A7J6WL83_THATH|nr:hypothetical protein FRX31_013053 [Thalictrum thalictroides]
MAEGNVAQIDSRKKKSLQEESDEEEWDVQASYAAIEREDEEVDFAFTSIIEERFPIHNFTTFLLTTPYPTKLHFCWNCLPSNSELQELKTEKKLGTMVEITTDPPTSIPQPPQPLPPLSHRDEAPVSYFAPISYFECY